MTSSEHPSSMIEVNRLMLQYGGQTVVDGFDVSVNRGEVLVLLGPSGCGKTSVMRCIAGLEQPIAGTIKINGVSIFDHGRGINVPSHKRNIGMVFQSYAIWPHRTVFENVAFALKMKKLPRDEIQARVQEALRLVGMEHLADRGASLLSGGQMQRVALGRSVAMQPTVLLLDEPLSNLDARLRDRLRVELREIQQRLGMTWVYVTHDQSEAYALADVIAVMEGGRIVQFGTPAEIHDRPATASIAEFLGVGNIIPCSVESVEDGTATALLDGFALRIQGWAPPGGAGQKRACIRAEDVSFVPSSHTSPNGVNQWDAQVALVSFQGGLVNYRVALSGGPVINVIRPRSEGKLSVGDLVRVVVPAQQVAIVAAGSAT